MNYNVTSVGSLDSALNKADAVFDERRSNMKKRMAMTLTALALSVIMAVPAYAGTLHFFYPCLVVLLQAVFPI